MRGDSLRDFYAKTLALLGLALVGGLGALIDYWPVTHPLPRVATSRPDLTPANLVARAESALESTAVSTAESSPAVRRRATKRVSPASMSVRVASASVVPGSSAVGFEAPPPSLAAIAVEPVVTFHATAVALIAPEQTPAPPMMFAQHASGQGSMDQGFLTDATEAAKKAGNTIMAGTMKTGASIVDGLRSVGGAVRRGLWRFMP